MQGEVILRDKFNKTLQLMKTCKRAVKDENNGVDPKCEYRITRRAI